MRGHVLSHLSHELRTPLAVIAGYAELLGLRDDEDTRREAAERIAAAAGGLMNIVDDLLVVLALETGELELACAPAALEPALLLAAEELEETATVLLECADAAWPTVLADDEHLRRILRNLLLYAASRSPGTTVVVTAARDGKRATISVRDEGPKLERETLERLFERFQPVEVPGRPELRSTGLELYKVRRLVELHGGSVWAGDGGRALSFTLPLAE